jgi:cell division protein FtsN
MPSFERGAYEPKSDDVRVFDEDEQEIDEEGSRLPLLIVIALLVLAAFGGVVWLAYSQGVQRGRADAPRMIVAAPGPVKEAAADMDQQRSLKIYQQPAPAEDDTAVNETTPLPPTPVTSKHEAPVAPKHTEMAQAPASKPGAKLADTAPKPAETKSAVASKTPAAVANPVETAKLPPPPAAKEEAAPVTGGAYVLQIGAYKSQSDADAAWRTFKSKHPMAAGYSESVQKADLGDKGTWYRLRMGGFADKAAAASFCDKLKADGGNCLVAK